MDIEELNKSQIVLLTLLVSFVTSIATGIVTVSLMNQAPPTVTQTINRVVERTVERVVPQETQTATVITKERTVIVKESELIAQAVDRAAPSIGEVYSLASEEKTAEFLSRAVVAAPGVAFAIITGAKKDDKYTIYLSNGTTTQATVTALGAKGVTALSFTESTTNPITPAAFVTTAPKLGQTVIALTGTTKIKVASGIVTGFSTTESVKEGETAPAQLFETSMSVDSLVAGSSITNTDGAILGLSIGTTAQVVPSSSVLSLLASISETKEKKDSSVSTTQ